MLRLQHHCLIYIYVYIHTSGLAASIVGPCLWAWGQIAPFKSLKVLHIENPKGPFRAEDLDNLAYCMQLEELRIIYAGGGDQNHQVGGFPMRLTSLTVCCHISNAHTHFCSNKVAWTFFWGERVLTLPADGYGLPSGVCVYAGQLVDAFPWALSSIESYAACLWSRVAPFGHLYFQT